MSFLAISAPLMFCTPGMGHTRKVYRFLAPQLVAPGYRVEGRSSARLATVGPWVRRPQPPGGMAVHRA